MQYHLGKGNLAVRGEADIEGLVPPSDAQGMVSGQSISEKTGKSAHGLFLVVG